jgi:predicted RNA-binding protein with PIN domain
MHIVIDGYNLIRRSAHFGTLESQDLQAGREALVDALAAYKKIKAFTITVVFDGMGAPLGMPRKDRLKGIELRYSRPGESADTVIKRMAHSQKEKLLVVSSDHEITDYALSHGAAIVSADEFEKRIMMAQMMGIKGTTEDKVSSGWTPTTKKTGPARRLPKRQRRMKRRISKL